MGSKPAGQAVLSSQTAPPRWAPVRVASFKDALRKSARDKLAWLRSAERQATATIQAVGAQWGAHRNYAARHFDGAIGKTAARLEKAASDPKAQAMMYHGCGAICGVIANQFDAGLLRARDAIKQIELAPLPTWQDILLDSRALVFGELGK
jgi:hypothetical protein